ncbi:hypothetical protein [Streptomyces sp. NRRL F-6628]|uniref:hypothetical protein n=1 Tax=Streptomyces sp. NRRL F-6628 TaxID=1463876 RepID=UPI00131B8604|nr:hypothetical protein [Streptomyces sp. NRRL F-6628]
MTGRQRSPAPVTSLPFTPILLRPLPHTVTPFANETLGSYRRRLAAANQTEFRIMRNPSRWLHCPLNELERLELISGQPRATLLWALPELRHYAPDIVPPPEIFIVNHRPACDLCAWRSGSNGQPIHVYIRGFHDNVCIRHRRWLSYGHVNDSKQINLSQAPEIVQAQLLLDQLERRHGASVFPDCYRLCERFWRGVDNRGLVRAGRDAVVQRIPQLNVNGLPDRFTVARSPRVRHAANYPQVARFTKLIISMALRPEPERRISHLTGETQTEFTQVFPLDRHPRGITIPWLRQALSELVDAVAKRLTSAEAIEPEPSRST